VRIYQSRLGKAFSDIISYTAADKSSYQAESVPNSTLTLSPVDNSNGQNSGTETFRVSLSSAVSSSSHGSGHDDFDAINDVFIWGEGIGNGMLGAGTRRVGLGNSYGSKMDALLPKALESKVVLDVHNLLVVADMLCLPQDKGRSLAGERSLAAGLGMVLKWMFPTQSSLTLLVV